MHTHYAPLHAQLDVSEDDMMKHYVVGVIVIALLLSLYKDIQAQTDSPKPTDTMLSTPELLDITATPELTPNSLTPVNQTINTENPNDIVRVIIELQGSSDLENPTLPRNQIQKRRAQIRTLQDGFLNRQSSQITLITRKSNIFPIVYVSMRRGDIDLLRADPQVTSINIEEEYYPTMFESTDLIGSKTANNSGYNGKGTSVAVLDTGVNKSHPFLSKKVVGEACFSTTNGVSTSLCPNQDPQSTAVNSGKPCPQPVEGCNHGTHVAGTIAGNILTISTKSNGIQTIRGVAPGAKIIAVQVFSRVPKSHCGIGATSDCVTAWTVDIDAALEWLYEKVSTDNAPAAWGKLVAINMSLGGGKHTSPCDSSSTKRYIDQLRTIGVATIIASGNNGYTNAISSPACISSAISVGSSTNNYCATWWCILPSPDKVSSFSNSPSKSSNNKNTKGDRLLDVLAPGDYILSSLAYPGTTYDYYQGTSMATPHVAGAWAVLKQASPNASVTQVLNWLYSTGKPITDSRNDLTLPRINVNNAVKLAVANTKPSFSVMWKQSNLYQHTFAIGNINGDKNAGKDIDDIATFDDNGTVNIYTGSTTNKLSLAQTHTFAVGEGSILPLCDPNNDGFDDILITEDRGSAWFVPGSSTGLRFDNKIKLATYGTGGAWAPRGQASQCFGDLSGDRIADVVIITDKNIRILQGGSTFPNTINSSSAYCKRRECVVAGVGDVNNDGINDIAIAKTQSSGKRDIRLFKGGRNVLANTPISITPSLSAYDTNYFASSFAGIGDINRDGFDDIAVAQYWNGVFVYLGSRGGYKTTPSWNATGFDVGLVASAGDVNADGNVDLFVGSPWQAKGRIYLGTRTGLQANPAWTHQGAGHFGWPGGSAGDINGDGCNDIFVGAHYYGGESKVFLNKLCN